ncbi:hypothetical protein BDEG_21674 [Batrachochytrium dendrobatidis JEL423]|uniref:Stress-response A/B barrel domain-containing protein n=1 Tax=Batrachochytrium dendrobatidis (strain JEL423) TaxID=403673 RepID=A0A177WC48_BATDL|nr:hypothetical protein BDEG_21674 [Batrachochytrium dendrobatidis JEL423]
MVVKHIVLFKFRDHTSQAILTKLDSSLKGLTCIPGVLDVSFGKTFTTERAQGFNHVLIATLKDRAALATYSTNPQHGMELLLVYE